MDLREFYAERAATQTARMALLARRGKVLLAASLSAFVLAVSAVVAYTVWGFGYWLLAAAVMLMVYLAVRKLDVANSRLTEECENLRRVYQKELAYLDGNFSMFDAGEQYVDPDHAYTFDMDIFGRDSLFNRINRTVTTGGSDYLAQALSHIEALDADGIARRSEAVSELAGREALRAAFLALGQHGQICTADILQALQTVRKARLPHFPLTTASLLMAVVSLLVFYGLVVGAALGLSSVEGPLLWALLQIVVAFACCARPLRSASRAIDVLYPRMTAYVSMMVQIVEAGLQAKELRDIAGQLSDGQADAVRSFRELKGILDGLDQRNEVWVPISNALFLGDYFLLRRFLRWQECYLLRMEDWIAAVSHFDALVSMGTFRYNEPRATEAVIVENDAVVYDATGLRHPFLGAKAVPGDFRIRDTHYYIITGANMAGKSTFLRAVGINYVLARCGMPVFAERLEVSLFALFSSMRTTDDLSRGISYFHAELLRLQQLIEYCQAQRHTLIILDEILKGTNSLDKLNGSRLFLESMLPLPVMGLIATHDLELSKMQQEHPDRFHNYCFEIQLSDEITYTYRITEGVARNQNATYLLKNILKTVRPAGFSADFNHTHVESSKRDR